MPSEPPSGRLWGAAFGGADPDAWARWQLAGGFRAAVWPEEATDVEAFDRAAGRLGLVWAEVGAWSNPLSPDHAVRAAAVERCQERLALAERLGARCCVNLAGGRGDTWDGPHPDNVGEETFELVFETVRSIVDAVKPRRAAYTLELMPWMWPWDAQGYLRLLRAVDRAAFAVHLDPVNALASPAALLRSGEVIRDLFHTLGPWTRSCHVKDATLLPGFPGHVQEVAPLRGSVDLAELLRQADALPQGVPLVLEHQDSAQAYLATAGALKGAGLW